MYRTLFVALSVLMIAGAAHMAQAQTDSSATTTINITAPLIASTTAASTTPIDPFDPNYVEADVRAYFADIPVMIAIAKCESGFEQYDSSNHPLYGGTGGMVGVFQEAAAIHNDAAKRMGWDINTLSGNLAFARYLYEQEGTTPWLSSSACWDTAVLSRPLTLGSSGAQVRMLQKMLNRDGYMIARSGPGSPGHESTIFGLLTRQAVRRLQCDLAITCSGSAATTGFRLVGSKTRLALAGLDAKFAKRSQSGELSVQ